MKRVLSVFLAAVLLLGCRAFAADDFSAGEDRIENSVETGKTTDEVTILEDSVRILTEDGLSISYVRPTQNVVTLTQDLEQQTLLYLLFYSNNLRAKAAEYIEEGMHLNVYDLDSDTDIYIYTEATLLSSLAPNLTAMSEDDVVVIQNYLKNNDLAGANSVTAGMIGSNLWIFADYGTAAIMLTFVNGIQIDCIFRYVDDSGPIPGLTLLDGLTVTAR